MSRQPYCEVCGSAYKMLLQAPHTLGTGLLWMPVQHLHHIFSRRFLKTLKLNPHDRLNIISVCQIDHGKCKKAEDRLIQGDVFGFLHAYRDMGMPLSYVWRAAKQYDLCEVLSLFRTESELK